ncbi:dTDP-4-amino-4,6-dideoxygalactose transaminase [Meinhardsimonia xiamenensis]|jgi:dTDP-4-amino-4,6-dideoxygalactose transaminase|uniref:dTDP-4-amino-4,6-dideoxygalactose transaminase n=2 Tax=Meinhardsimonia xiamenensis TaxID=990712 RepID=A0A1G9FMB8_9RHOB|nr:dTDP-4-amino-4,6-dideoxygalactose transaminase [Meinhardsimonia xiamenensis]SDK89588.1 dTDP-4-amino-4,6-dideoxygalactose transaminase [Meinhardsimonia xiamenensis]
MLDIARQRARLEPGLGKAIERVLEHTAFINGPEVRALEAALSEYAGVAHAVACANGTDALQIMLRALGIGAGDAVFVPSLTFVATAEAVALAGATPVFVDVGRESGTMDPDSLAATVAKVRDGRRLTPRAVLAVDLFSIPADHARLSQLCAAEDLFLCYDAAQSFGTETPWGRSGSYGTAAATSFYPSKSLGAFGDAGAVMTADGALAARIRAIANHGVEDGAHALVGTNSRLDTLQAAILLEKLGIFDEELAARRRIAHAYGEALDGLVQTPAVPEGVDPCWAYYVIRTPRRDALMSHLAEAGVPSVAYYRRPTHLHPAFAEAPRAPGGLPATEEWGETLLCLPSHPYLTDAEISQVIDAVRGFFTAR